MKDEDEITDLRDAIKELLYEYEVVYDDIDYDKYKDEKLLKEKIKKINSVGDKLIEGFQKYNKLIEEL